MDPRDRGAGFGRAPRRGAATTAESGTPAWASVVKIVLGVLLVLLAFKQWRGRPREGVAPEAPSG
ncbi:hypothetical protein NKG05_28480 [Oerskovia sp. M15]